MLTLFQICHIANVLQHISWKPCTHPDMHAHTQTLPVTSQLDVKYDIEQIIQSSELILCLSHVQIIVEAIISQCCQCKELHIFFIISAHCSLLPFQFIIPPLWSALGPDIIRENSPVVACLCSLPLHFVDWWHQQTHMSQTQDFFSDWGQVEHCLSGPAAKSSIRPLAQVNSN